MTTTLLPHVTHCPSMATAVSAAVKTLFGTTSAETELTVAAWWLISASEDPVSYTHDKVAVPATVIRSLSMLLNWRIPVLSSGFHQYSASNAILVIGAVLGHNIFIIIVEKQCGAMSCTSPSLPDVHRGRGLEEPTVSEEEYIVLIHMWVWAFVVRTGWV